MDEQKQSRQPSGKKSKRNQTKCNKKCVYHWPTIEGQTLSLSHLGFEHSISIIKQQNCIKKGSSRCVDVFSYEFLYIWQNKIENNNRCEIYVRYAVKIVCVSNFCLIPPWLTIVFRPTKLLIYNIIEYSHILLQRYWITVSPLLMSFSWLYIYILWDNPKQTKPSHTAALRAENPNVKCARLAGAFGLTATVSLCAATRQCTIAPRIVHWRYLIDVIEFIFYEINFYEIQFWFPVGAPASPNSTMCFFDGYIAHTCQEIGYWLLVNGTKNALLPH